MLPRLSHLVTQPLPASPPEAKAHRLKNNAPSMGLSSVVLLSLQVTRWRNRFLQQALSLFPVAGAE
jgi:hypothetical protein